MRHIGRHVWKLKSKDILKSVATIAAEKGMAFKASEMEFPKDRILCVFECAICGTEKVEWFQ